MMKSSKNLNTPCLPAESRTKIWMVFVDKDPRCVIVRSEFNNA